MSSKNEQQVTWAGSNSITVSSNTIQWGDPIVTDASDWDGSVQVHADNAGTPANGDTCSVYVAWSNGDILGDTGNDFDTDEHAQFLGMLDTYPSNTPGEDPSRKTLELHVSGKTAYKIGVLCPQAATRNILVRARVATHRDA